VPRRKPTEGDRQEAVQRLLIGLMQGTDLDDLAFSIEHLHPRDNTFPGEVFMEVAIQAMDLADMGQRGLPYEDLLNRHLGEYEFRGRRAQKIKFAILATASARGGIDPDLLEEITWWQTDDFWSYALGAAVAIIGACAEKQSVPTGEFVATLARRLNIDLETPVQ
jgi:hypothetical protein